MDDPSALASEVSVLTEVNLSGVLSALTVLVIAFIVIRVTTSTLAGLGTRFLDKRLLLHQIATITRFVLWSLGAVLAVRALALPREVLIGLTGGAAVTIGFALKDLVASILAGLTIIIDRPFQVGDRVAFGEYYGEISAIGLRSVRLVTLDDNVITIPNNKFLTESVSSGNVGALDMLIQLDFLIGVDQDFATAKKLVEQCMLSNRYVYTKKPWAVLISTLMVGNYPVIRVRAKAYVLDVQYEKAYETDVTERVLGAFREHAILPPAILHRSLDSGTIPQQHKGAGETHAPITTPSLGETHAPITNPSLGETHAPITNPSLGETHAPITTPSLGETHAPITNPSTRRARPS